MTIAYKYSHMGNTILITVFFLPILPIGVAFAFFGMLIMYFIEKYNVQNMYKRPEKIDGRITKTYLDYFRITIFVYALSNYIFMGNLYVDSIKWDVICLIIFFILVFIPNGLLLRKITLLGDLQTESLPYNKSYFELGINYEMTNPMTKVNGFQNYLVKLLEKNYITHEEYKENIEKCKTAPSDIIELYYQKLYKGKTIARKAKTKLFSKILKNDTYNNSENKKNTSEFMKKLGGGLGRKSKIKGIFAGKRTSTGDGILLFGNKIADSSLEVDNNNVIQHQKTHENPFLKKKKQGGGGFLGNIIKKTEENEKKDE